MARNIFKDGFVESMLFEELTGSKPELHMPNKVRVFLAAFQRMTPLEKRALDLLCIEKNIKPVDYVYALFQENYHKLAPLFPKCDLDRRNELLVKEKLLPHESEELRVLLNNERRN